MSHHERTKRTSLGRLALRRVARPRSAEPAVAEPVTTSRAVPWSRGLWGVFLPDRRTDGAPLPPSAIDRRTALSPTA